MPKYFCGIKIYGEKYTVSIIDDSLNIIFIDVLDSNSLFDIIRMKSPEVLSIDAPVALYIKYFNNIDANKRDEKVIIKRRPADNLMYSKNLFTYRDRFNISFQKLELVNDLVKQLNNLGYCIKKPGEIEKSIIESYPDTSFAALGFSFSKNSSPFNTAKQKVEFLRIRNMRINNIHKSNITIDIADSLCQAYTSLLYSRGNISCAGNMEDGLLVIPVNGALNGNNAETLRKPNKVSERFPSQVKSSINMGNSVTEEYCGAQYLYTNTDGIIRIDDLRPIKSYRPFTEIYEMDCIKHVQVTIGTTDGLRKVKANLIPNMGNRNCFRAANEEDKKKLDSFWGSNGDKRGYLIKFIRVEVVKA